MNFSTDKDGPNIMYIYSNFKENFMNETILIFKNTNDQFYRI